MRRNISNNATGGKLERLLVPFLVVLGVGSNFLKEMLIAYYYGASTAVDVFRIASSIPNSFFQALGVVFVGLYLPYVLNVNEIKLVVVTRKIMQASIIILIIGIPLTFFYPAIFAPGLDFHLNQSLISQGLLCWIGFGIMSLSFQRRLWLQAHNNKNTISATSFINSAAFIGSITLLTAVFGVNEWNLSLSFLVASVFIFFAYTMACSRGVSVFLQVKSMFVSKSRHAIGNTVIVIAVLFHATQIVPRIIDRLFASYGDEGSISHLEYAYNFHTALGMVVGTSIVILLSRDIAMMRNDAYLNWRSLVGKSGGFIAILILMSALVAIFSEDIVRLVYMRGNFDSTDVIATSSVLTYLIIGLPLYVVNMILIQIVFAHGISVILVVSAFVKVSAKYISIDYVSVYGYEYMFGVSNVVSELSFMLVIILMLNAKSIFKERIPRV